MCMDGQSRREKSHWTILTRWLRGVMCPLLIRSSMLARVESLWCAAKLETRQSTILDEPLVLKDPSGETLPTNAEELSRLSRYSSTRDWKGFWGASIIWTCVLVLWWWWRDRRIDRRWWFQVLRMRSKERLKKKVMKIFSLRCLVPCCFRWKRKFVFLSCLSPGHVSEYEWTSWTFKILQVPSLPPVCILAILPFFSIYFTVILIFIYLFYFNYCLYYGH